MKQRGEVEREFGRAPEKIGIYLVQVVLKRETGRERRAERVCLMHILQQLKGELAEEMVISKS
jgi:hypothetical protein